MQDKDDKLMLGMGMCRPSCEDKVEHFGNSYKDELYNQHRRKAAATTCTVKRKLKLRELATPRMRV